MIETILSTLTTNNKHQCWDLILAAVSVSDIYVFHNLNSLDVYTLCIVHEQHSVVARHKRVNYIAICYWSCAIQHVIHMYIHFSHVTCIIFEAILLAHTHTNVLSCIVCIELSLFGL